MNNGSGEYFFGLGRGRLPEAFARRVDEVARRHGATFVNPCMPGEDYRYWFAAPNRGHPFDQATAAAVHAGLEAEELDIEAEVARCSS